MVTMRLLGMKSQWQKALFHNKLPVFAGFSRFLPLFSWFWAIWKGKEQRLTRLRALFKTGRDRRIERGYDGCGKPKMTGDFGCEIRLERGLNGQLRRDAPLTAADEIKRRMGLAIELGWKAFGWTGESLPFKLLKCAA